MDNQLKNVTKQNVTPTLNVVVRRNNNTFEICSVDSNLQNQTKIITASNFDTFLDKVFCAEKQNLLNFLLGKSVQNFTTIVELEQDNNCSSKFACSVVSIHSSSAEERFLFTFISLESQSKLQSLENSIYSSFSGNNTTKESLESAARVLLEFTQTKSLEIWKYDRSTKNLNLYFHFSTNKSFILSDSEVFPNYTFKIGEGLVGTVFKEQKEINIDDLEENPIFIRQKEAEISNCKTGFGLPLTIQDKKWGVLLLFSDKSIYTSSDFNKGMVAISKIMTKELIRKRKESTYEMLFNSAKEPVFLLNSAMKIVKANRACDQLFSSFDYVNQNLLDFVRTDDQKIITDFWLSFKRDEENKRIQIELINGKTIEINATVPSTHKNNYFIFVKDISEEIKSTKFLDFSNELVNIGNWEYDYSGGIFHFSDKAKNLLKIKQNKLSKDKFLSLLTKESKVIFERFLTNKSFVTTDFELIESASNARWYRITGEKNIDPNQMRIKGCILNISKSKRLELELKNRTDSLANLNILSNNLIKAKDIENVLEITKNRFQKKFPLTSISLFKIDFKGGFHLIKKIKENDYSSDLELQEMDEIESVLTRALNGKMTCNSIEIGKNKFATTVSIPLKVEDKISMLLNLSITSDKPIKSLRTLDAAFLISASRTIGVVIDRLYFQSEIEKLNHQNQLIIESVNDGFISLDIDGHILFWNKYASSLLNINKKFDDVYGKVCSEIINNPELDKVKSYIEEAKQIKKNIHFEVFLGSSQKWLEFSIYFKEPYISIIFKDITSRKKSISAIEAANKRFEIINKTSNDAIWEWDIENDILHWGSGFKRIFKIDTMTTKPTLEEWNKRIHPYDLKRVTENLRKILVDKSLNSYEINYSFKRGDNTYANILDSAIVIRGKNNKPLKLIGTLSDISAQVEYENSLKELNKRLKLRTKELEEMNKDLEQFAYISSHDMKEPLRTITSFLTRLKEKYGDTLDEKATKYVDFSVEGAAKMRTIIDDLLQYSKATNFQRYKDEFEVKAIIESIKPLFENTLIKNNIDFKYDNLGTIKTYKTPFRQVLINLISNAIKYCDTKKENPSIKIHAHESKKYTYVCVIDNGIGFDPEYKNKIFSIFQRLHTDHLYEGTGIGLAIVKRILDKIDATIEVKSEIGVGSTFTIGIPKE